MLHSCRPSAAIASSASLSIYPLVGLLVRCHLFRPPYVFSPEVFSVLRALNLIQKSKGGGRHLYRRPEGEIRETRRMVDCTGRYSLTHIRTSLPRSGRGGGADLHDRPPLAGALVFPTLSQGLGTRGDQQNTEVWSVVVGLGPAGSKLKTWVAIKTGDKRATRRGRIHRSGSFSFFFPQADEREAKSGDEKRR